MKEINGHKVTKEGDMKIRTRGSIRTRGVATEERRTRGESRTRGATARPQEKPLEELMTELREKAHGSPIAVLIHGWDEEPSKIFLMAISSLLDEVDAIWLVPLKGTELADMPAGLSNAVVLDFSREVDIRTYDCLVVDIVFADEEPENIDKWSKRAEVIIVSSSIGRYDEVVYRAGQNGQNVYSWSDSEPDKLMSI